MRIRVLASCLGVAVLVAGISTAQTHPPAPSSNCFATELINWEVHKVPDAPQVQLDSSSKEGFRINYDATAPHELNPGRKVYISAQLDARPGTYRLSAKIRAAEDYGNALPHPTHRRYFNVSISKHRLGEFGDSNHKVLKHAGVIDIQQDVEIAVNAPSYITTSTNSVRTGVIEAAITLCLIEPPPSPARLPPGLEGAPAKEQPKETSESLTSPQRVWFEQSVVKATTGYDAKTNRTLISSYSLVVFGPESLETAAVGIAQQCAEQSGLASVAAFQQTPSPEVGARIGAAWAAFKVALQRCFSMKEVTKSLESKFDLGYVRRAEWESGVVLHFDADNPTAVQYRKMHELVQKELPEPINKAVRFFISTQEIPKVNIRIRVPSAAKPFLQNLPDTAALQSFMDQANERAKKTGQRLVSQTVAETKKRANQIDQDGVRLQLVSFKLAEDTSKQVVEEISKVAPEVAKQFGEAAKTLSNKVEEEVDRCKRNPADCFFNPGGIKFP